jgi:DNA-binding XRE family transcriptional regulator
MFGNAGQKNRILKRIRGFYPAAFIWDLPWTWTPVHPKELIMFGQKLQQLCANAGLTQDELAKNVGVSVKTLQGWEVGAGEPGSGALSKLAAALGVAEEEFAAGFAEARQIRETQVVSAPRDKPR